MASLSRQQRRLYLRKLRKHHKSLLSGGMPPAGTPELAHSLALLFRDCIENGENGRGIIDAANLAYSLYDLSESQHPPSSPLSCKAGCKYCCYSFVAISAPEAFMIAEQLQEAVDKNGFISPEGFMERARPLTGINLTDRYKNEVFPCPLLNNDKCSIYKFRPIVCRKTSSYSVEACIAGFKGSGNETIPQDTNRQTFGEGCLITLMAALRSLGYTSASYEMSEAVSKILETDDALQRWVNGEDILADVQMNLSGPPELETAIDEFAAAIS